jgi:3-dehydroquinate dehydratase-2
VTRVLVVTGQDLGRRGPRLGAAATRPRESLADLRLLLAGIDGVTVDFRQTDDEAELISWLHEAVETTTGVVLDPLGFTHYSYGLRDAAAQVTESGLPLIEVHLTNPASPAELRAASVISGVATGMIAGLGVDSYLLAVRAAAARVPAVPAAAPRP